MGEKSVHVRFFPASVADPGESGAAAPSSGPVGVLNCPGSGSRTASSRRPRPISVRTTTDLDER